MITKQTVTQEQTNNYNGTRKVWAPFRKEKFKNQEKRATTFNSQERQTKKQKV